MLQPMTLLEKLNRDVSDLHILRVREEVLWQALCQILEENRQCADIVTLVENCRDMRNTVRTSTEVGSESYEDVHRLVPFLSREWRTHHPRITDLADDDDAGKTMTSPEK